MFAFVPAAAPLASAFSGSALRVTSARPAAALRMQSGKSCSIPFLDAPPKLGAKGALPGGAQFDPLGFSNMWDINFLQEAEIKHARVAMLGITGWVFPEAFGTLPAAAYHNTNPIQAMTEVGFLPMAQIFLACMVFEGIAYNKKAKKNYANPGDYGWDAFGLTKSGGANNHYRRAEIKNGRLGAIGGAIHHAIITQTGLLEQINTGNWFGGPGRPF